MALENAAAPAKRKRGQAPAHRREDKDRVPVEILRDQWDRPLIVPPGVDVTTYDLSSPVKDGLVAYIRASTLGEQIEDHYHIERRNLRYLAYGMGRSRAQWMLAKAVEEPEEQHNRRTLDKIVKDCLTLAGADDLADIGTALHALAVRQCQGEVLDASELEEDAAALAAIADVMTRFEVLATEVFVVNDELGAAGTFDYLVRTLVDLPAPDGTIIAAGTILVLDLKTASTNRYFGPKFSVQQLVYVGGKIYDAATGERIEFACDERWALIMHAPSGGAMAQIHVIDMDEAREDTRVALDIHARRKVKGRFTLITDLPEVEPGCDVHGPHPGTVDCVDCIYGEPGRLADLAGPVVEAIHEAAGPALAPVMANGALVHKDGCECFGCTGEPISARIGRKLDEAAQRNRASVNLTDQIRRAPDRDACVALYEAHRDIWTDHHHDAVRARLAIVGAREGATA